VDYASLRDNVVSPLITQFGRTAYLRKEAKAYTPSSGTAVITATDTAIRLVELSAKVNLPAAFSKDAYMDAEVGQWDSEVLMSAKELAAAGVTPAAGDVVVVGSSVRRIVWMRPIHPGGVAVAYKAGVAQL
jgi:hypothetical protein